MSVRRIVNDDEMVDSSKEEFARLTEKTPYLVMRENRAYFAMKGRGRLPVSIPAPKMNDAIDPAQLELGGLYEVFRKLKMPYPPFTYEVQFKIKGDGPLLKIATVRFGEKLTRDDFTRKIESHFGFDSTDALAVDAILMTGQVKVLASTMAPFSINQ